MRHKHADLIHAWAEGAEIERRSPLGAWFSVMDCDAITWDAGCEYRIKPEKKPDVVKHGFIELSASGRYVNCIDTSGPFAAAGANMRFTFSGETGELIKAEVIK